MLRFAHSPRKFRGRFFDPSSMLAVEAAFHYGQPLQNLIELRLDRVAVRTHLISRLRHHWETPFS
jgi:hypothetical protein